MRGGCLCPTDQKDSGRLAPLGIGSSENIVMTRCRVTCTTQACVLDESVLSECGGEVKGGVNPGVA